MSTTDETLINRQFVDALRGFLGLEPLYQSAPPPARRGDRHSFAHGQTPRGFVHCQAVCDKFAGLE